VTLAGRTHEIGQANNAFIFPGVGLGSLVTEAREVTQGMFLAAARALVAEVHEDRLRSGALFPRVRDLRAVTVRIATAVAREAVSSGVARTEATDVDQAVRDAIWDPLYPDYEPA
jgi:malate dehydrogenase (oxaloacetate-decarboxylating)